MMDSVSPSVEMIPLPTFTEQILSDSTSFALRHVSPRELRPLPQVSQETPSGPRPKSNNPLGRTRILTDTPEKNLIEEDHKKRRKKKINEKKGKTKRKKKERKKPTTNLFLRRKRWLSKERRTKRMWIPTVMVRKHANRLSLKLLEQAV
jgi:hypothetical protein